ncbi:uncharacterized protein LOC123924085 [Trifolium pratense]|nr:uncharacterized protein LOC123924085 [Trifolium pratense]
MIKIINPLFFLCLITSIIGNKVDGMHSALDEDYERHLNLINKARVTSIQTKSGNIVDCVDINKQPAFDHPLLKNQTLQIKSSIKISPTKSIYGLEKVRCPKGTVPIQRITKDDLIRGKSLFNEISQLTDNGVVTHSAHVYLQYKFSPYYGVTGIGSVYNPKVVNGQSSAGHVFVSGDGMNKIYAGWHVSPKLYNDDKTHLYILWTPDNFKSGCYNLLCSGFIQTDETYHIGAPIAKTSTYGGEMVEMPISIYKDEHDNWVVRLVDRDIGHFPKAIFSNFNIAHQVAWGGSTSTPAGVASPPMGSGDRPNDDFIYGAYFREVGFRAINGVYNGPPDDFADTYDDGPGCYGVAYYGDQKGEVGYSLMFGGPGGANCNR